MVTWLQGPGYHGGELGTLWQTGSGGGGVLRTQCNLQRRIPSDLLPPVRLCLLMFPTSSNIVFPTGINCSKHEPVGIFYIKIIAIPYSI